MPAVARISSQRLCRQALLAVAAALGVAAPLPAAEPSAGAAGAAGATDAVPLPAGLLIPVEGVAARELRDTFADRRGAGRHEAIDIMARRGTPVVAVADGSVAKLFASVPGGLTLYQFDPQGNYAYYYAHLDAYAPGLRQGMALKRGDPIGTVGSTGDASPDAPHLHFAVFRLGPEKQWWKGTAIDPYPLLVGSAAPAPGPIPAAKAVSAPR